jgi:transmembrane sensor
VPLQDGSQVTLNTGSRLRVELTDSERRVELQQGEAFFEVAHDRARPFIVAAGSRRIVVLGTQFSVRRDGDKLDVAVTEGSVRLESDAAGADALLLEAGQLASVDAHSGLSVAKLAPAAAQRRLAWRLGDVDFDGESLAQAVAEINRHNQRHIVIDDPVLARRPVIGTFTANDPEAFATTVAATFDALKVDAPDAIHLRRDGR